MDYLVTGGAGFIGSHIARFLVEQGRPVRVLDNLSTGDIANIGDVLDQIDFVQGDLVDVAAVAKAVQGVKYVLHLGALPSVPRSVQDPVRANEANLTGTLNLLVAARDAGAKRFVFSSSSSVYGDTPVLPKKEDMLPAPLSPYAVQKLAGEHYCRIFHSLYGLETVVLRYFNVFGPRQNLKTQYAAVIPIFIKRLHEGQGPTIHGDGGQTRDFTFVEDVVRANLAACDAPAEAAGGVFNIACGQRISVRGLAEQLIAIMGAAVQPIHDDPVPGDVRDSQADVSEAARRLGWQARVPFEQGLERTIAWYTR
ncbi:MAG: SDR family oxidoreductase [Kiritimatiellae bacterium]|nr:SDR family oxidoreductase [Kiritimatiellia bacterium]